jgi:MarR family transcriptional regulator, 2-MHQ and catechol-resistance regulon repressor
VGRTTLVEEGEADVAADGAERTGSAEKAGRARTAAGGDGGILGDPRLTAMGLLAETFTGLQAKIGPALAEAGLSTTDFDVLLRLGRSAGRQLRMTDLAIQTALSTSGITRVVDRLEHRGLVRRQACASDRRGAFAVLTGDGQRLLTGVVQAHVRDIDRWFTGLLRPDQRDALLTALRILRDEVRPGATAGVCSPGAHGKE